MKRSYTDYINIIDEVESMEQVIITDKKKKCCYYSLEPFKLESFKLGVQYIKNKIVNVNINGKKKNKNDKTGLSVSSTDEDSREIVKETLVTEFACPTCKNF